MDKKEIEQYKAKLKVLNFEKPIGIYISNFRNFECSVLHKQIKIKDLKTNKSLNFLDSKKIKGTKVDFYSVKLVFNPIDFSMIFVIYDHVLQKHICSFINDNEWFNEQRILNYIDTIFNNLVIQQMEYNKLLAIKNEYEKFKEDVMNGIEVISNPDSLESNIERLSSELKYFNLLK